MNRDPRGFLARVKDAAKFDTIKEADEATRATLRSMRSVLSSDQRNRLSQSLPGPYASELQSDEADGDPDIDRETFIGRMMSKLPTEALWDQSLGGLDLVSVPAGDEAARRTQAVFAGIKGTVDTEFAEEIAGALPEDIADWFRNA